VENTEEIANKIVNALGINQSIRSIYIEKTESPWNEKALIERKKDHLDVRITLWEDSAFLYGRIYRLFLYVCDVLNPHFLYNPEIAPKEDKESRLKNRHNQIWSIYVDSRLEKNSIENFFNKAVRKNVFIDAEKGLSWEQAAAIFEKLWEKGNYTYPEITDYTHNLETLSGENRSKDSFELHINKDILNHHVKDHIDKLSSAAFRKMVNDLLRFTAYHCKETNITSSYYGISLVFQKRLFAEMIATTNNTLLLTLLDPLSDAYETETVTEDSNIEFLQKHIKEIYNRLAANV